MTTIFLHLLLVNVEFFFFEIVLSRFSFVSLLPITFFNFNCLGNFFSTQTKQENPTNKLIKKIIFRYSIFTIETSPILKSSSKCSLSIAIHPIKTGCFLFLFNPVVVFVHKFKKKLQANFVYVFKC